MKVLGTDLGGGSDSTSVIISYETVQRYRRSFGSSSAFFQALARGVFLGASCQTCSRTFFPPREYCPDDLGVTALFELTGSGTVAAATRVHTASPLGGIDAPYVLAIVRLDGVDGSITHRILGDQVPEAGVRVSATYLGDELMHPLLRVAFQIQDNS